ncbi:sensor histidine kinase [Abyssalbus ytuae]|uniref:histidine kinase n=1 Tax=Abyssalbus ytuae TaxID=2926907 RepID=A0A9E6ZYR6_9FLAO|nr:ATP-binding protein [Abyssalbus ytuae]UOB16341.1 ATP-binding protein [Abyssalbus ytuae]
MAAKLKKSYKFALRSSTFITLLSLVVLSLLLYFFSAFSIKLVLIFCLLLFFLSFIILQYRVEKFIYKRIKKIYDDVSLLESSSFQDQPITTDMSTLTEEIEKFAKDKKLEIETLKVRENYRKEFLGNVSHELKTPLFTVQGYILTLLEGGALKDRAVRKKYLQRASKGVERLIYIVKDLDMIAKLESGDLNLEYEDFDIVELAQSVFEMLEMKAAKKNISIVFDTKYEPIMVNADKERIQQVLTNLVVNSIKYGKGDGTTEVSIENLVKNKIIVRVTDNGEGIEKKNIPRLFERFYRVDKSGSRKEGGSGLGLSIVKHIIEAHKEKIYVESVFGVGSEFSFTLEKAKQTTEV